jgi:glycosyltransferase involved in cell wall biosynthesis
MPQPLVSVGIPTYNRPAGLRRTLACIAGQTYTNLEIMVSDNCSPSPEVEDILRLAAAGDPRIRFVRHASNMGAIRNLTYLCEQATGEFFMWAADDDGWENTFIEKHLAILVSHPHLSIAMCQTTYRLTGGETLFPRFQQGLAFNSLVPNSSERRVRLAVGQNFGELFYGLYRRSSLISDVAPRVVDFESLGLIHVAVRAMMYGDAYVSNEYLYTKDVTEEAYVWTYLCARRANPAGASGEADQLIARRIEQKQEALRASSLVSRSASWVYYLAKSTYLSLRWHVVYFASHFEVVLAHAGAWNGLIALSTLAVSTLSSAVWTVYARMKYTFRAY